MARTAVPLPRMTRRGRHRAPILDQSPRRIPAVTKTHRDMVLPLNQTRDALISGFPRLKDGAANEDRHRESHRGARYGRENAVVWYLIVGGFLVWAGWPVSGYALVVGVLAVALRPQGSGVPSRPRAGAREGLYQTALAVLIGLSLVWVAQLLLLVHDEVATSSVKQAEALLIHVRSKLERVLGIGPLLLIAVTATISAIYQPEWRVGSALSVVRRYAGRLLLVVATAASFTFFTRVDIASQEGPWIARRRTEIDSDEQEIARTQRKLGAMATVKLAWETTDDKPREVAAYLKSAAATGNGPEIVVRLARSVGNQRPDRRREAEVIGSDIGSAAPTADGLDDVGVLAMADRTHERAEKMERALEEGRSQLQEVISKGLEQLIPESVKGLVRPFVETLVDTIAEKAVDRAYPEGVTDLGSAVRWAKLQQEPETSSSWDWEHVQIPKVEHLENVEHLEKLKRFERLDPAPRPRDRWGSSEGARRFPTREAETSLDRRSQEERTVDGLNQNIQEEARPAAEAPSFGPKPRLGLTGYRETELELHAREHLTEPRVEFHARP